MNIKEVIIKDEEEYNCKIQVINNFIQVSIFVNNIFKYEGNIHLSKIQNQIRIFDNYNIHEIFQEINLLDSQNFKIVKEIFQIEFIILRRKHYITINLVPNENLDKDNLIKQIIELKEIIRSKDDKIKSLEYELNKYRNEIPQQNTSNFDIKLKEPIHILNNHTSSVWCSTLLNDGRFATGSGDNSIIIYNNKTFKPDLIIKEHSYSVSNLTQLSSGILASCSSDKTIKLFNITDNQYQIIQTLNYHQKDVNQVIELNNKKLVSCSSDKSIIFYMKDNNEYKFDFQLSFDGKIYRMIQIKENEIAYSKYNNGTYKYYICFFDLLGRKNITEIELDTDCYSLNMITKDLLLRGGNNKLVIINVNTHDLIRTINVTNSSYISSICMLNNNMLLTGDDNHNIKQWKIEGDNLILFSEKATEGIIYTLLKLPDGHIISGDDNGVIKIW